MSNPDYGKRITTTTYYGGEESKNLEEIESDLKLAAADKPLLLKHVMDSIALVTTGKSKKLTLEVIVGKNGDYQMKQRWVV